MLLAMSVCVWGGGGGGGTNPTTSTGIAYTVSLYTELSTNIDT